MSLNTSAKTISRVPNSATLALERVRALRVQSSSVTGAASASSASGSGPAVPQVVEGVDTSDSEDEATNAANSMLQIGAPSSVSAAVATSLPFEGVNPQLMLKYLKNLAKEKLRDGKPLPKAYVKWDTMNEMQRNKTAAFFNLNIDNGTRQALLALARADLHREVEEDRERAALTNKHDKCRLLHLRADGKYATLWSQAFREMTRSELDADSPPNYYEQLADAFNNYAVNVYQNASIVPGAVNAQGTYVARPGKESIAQYTYDLNPTMYPRPIRDAGWVRTQLRTMRAKISVVWANFKKSGQQDAENLCDEWVKFSTSFGDDVTTYAFVVFSMEMMDHMGKRLTDAMAIDTGVLGEISPAVERARKEKRKKDLDAAMQGGKALTVISDAIKTGIERNELMHERAQKRANKMSMVEMYLRHASDARKERVLDSLAKCLTDKENWDIDLANLFGINEL